MDFIFELLDNGQERAWALADYVWNHKYMVIARQVVVVFLLAILLLNILLAASVVIYSIFYYLYVPVAMHTWPLHFSYGRLASESSSGDLKYHPHVPHTFVKLGGDGGIFASNQGYDFFVELELPDTPANRESGVFMVFLTLATDRTLAKTHALQSEITTQAHEVALVQGKDDASVSIARPGTLRYKPWIVTLIQNVVFAGPLMFGLMDHSHRLTIPLFSDIQDCPDKPYTWATVTLSNPRMDVYSANLKAYANMKGLTYLMYHWFFTSFVVGVYSTAMFLFTISVITIVVVWRIRRQRQEAEAEAAAVDDATTARLAHGRAPPTPPPAPAPLPAAQAAIAAPNLREEARRPGSLLRFDAEANMYVLRDTRGEGNEDVAALADPDGVARMVREQPLGMVEAPGAIATAATEPQVSHSPVAGMPRLHIEGDEGEEGEEESGGRESGARGHASAPEVQHAAGPNSSERFDEPAGMAASGPNDEGLRHRRV